MEIGFVKIVSKLMLLFSIYLLRFLLCVARCIYKCLNGFSIIKSLYLFICHITEKRHRKDLFLYFMAT